MSGCWADGSDPLLERYHDEEWGRPVTDERELFERFSLEAFQSGLSWRTVLAKRPAFREQFVHFDAKSLAQFGKDDVARLLADSRLIRNRRKIEAVLTNARVLVATELSLRTAMWSRATGVSVPRAALSEVPASTPQSVALARELKRAGIVFVGPTTAYAAMQACGVVNDHLADCPVRDEVEQLRREALARLPL